MRAAVLGTILASPAAAVTLTGSITAADSSHQNFLPQNVASSCATPTTASVQPDAAAFHYDTFTLINQSASASCVTVAYTASSNVSIAAYSPSFDPGNLGQNFLGSTLGLFPGCGGLSGSFSFTVTANASFVVEIEECNAAGGVASYSLEVTGSGVVVAARFRSLSASATARGTLVRWRTASELDVLGFNVYRAVNGKRLRLNKRLIPAANLPSGRAYSYLDRTARRGKSARYWIQAVNMDGSRSWYGPARIARR